MSYLYSLPNTIILLMILLAIFTIIIQIINSFFTLINRDNIIKNIYNIIAVLYYAIILGIVASVQRHLTEYSYSSNYYLGLRYLTIIFTVSTLIHIIKNKSYINIPIMISSFILLPFFENVFKESYAYIYLICVLYYFIYATYCLIDLYSINKKEISIFSIKEALDSLPIGICLANKKNKIIFNNVKMIKILKYNGIDSRIKVIDLWNEIKKKDEIFEDDYNAILKTEDDVFMVVLEKSNELKYQIKATSVKMEYEIIDNIKKANMTLEAQEKQLREYIYTIEEVERQKSLLRIKGRIHDVLAQRLSIIHQYLDNSINEIETSEIKKLLISMTEDIKEEKELLPEDIKNSIIQAYELIGMKIMFEGNIKEIKENAILKIVREAATNALRHGGATELNVEAKDNIVTITNNGENPLVLKEGNGIKNMRFIANENKLDIDFMLDPYRIIIKY